MLINALKKAHPDLIDLRIREIVVNKQNKKINCVLSYPEYDKLLVSTRDAVAATVKNFVPSDFTCSVRFENDYFSEESFLNFVLNLIKKHFAVLSIIPKRDFETERLDDRKFRLKISVSPYQNELIKESGFASGISNLTDKYTSYKILLETVVLETKSNVIDLEAEREKQLSRVFKLELMRPKRQLSANQRVKYIGKLIAGEPIYISDIRESRASVVLCGKIENKTLTVSKSNPNLRICKFLLKDESAEIQVVFFVQFKIEDVKILETVVKNTEAVQKTAKRNTAHNEKLAKLLATLYDGAEVVVHGKAVYNEYSSKFEVHGYDLNKCRLESSPVEKIKKAAEPLEYVEIFPEILSEGRQISIGEMENAVEAETQKDRVICSVSTTGHSIFKDRLLAISMIRIKDGAIVEVLKTFLNPELKFNQNIFDEAGIDFEKIKTFPTLPEVLADLYKFSFNSILVGADVNLVVEFLRFYGRPQGILFENECVNLGELLESLCEKTEINKKIKSFAVADIAKALNINFNEKEKPDCFAGNLLAAKCVEKLLTCAVKR